MRCGYAEVGKCRQATSPSWVLWAMLGCVDLILRVAELPDTPCAIATPNSAWLHSHSWHFHNFLLLFILLLQLQMPASPGKIVLTVLSCILDNLELLSLNLTWTLCHRPPLNKCCENKPMNPDVLLTVGMVFESIVLFHQGSEGNVSQNLGELRFFQSWFVYLKHTLIHLKRCFFPLLNSALWSTSNKYKSIYLWPNFTLPSFYFLLSNLFQYPNFLTYFYIDCL